MASGGSSVTQWRLLAQLRDYLARTTPAISSLQLQELLKKVSGITQSEPESRSPSEILKVEGEDESKTQTTLKPVGEIGS